MSGRGGRWLVYGANGFTGRLIAAEARERGLEPVLAGRREGAVREVAEPLGLEWRTFRLDDPLALARGIGDVQAVLLAAGPFSATSAPVVDACLAEGVHYLDITGEIPVFEAVFARDSEARERGVALVPGVAFNVVPSDCLAASLAVALPDADRLVLASAPAHAGPSAGTARTMVEILGRGGAIRRDGRIVRVPLAWREAEIPFADRPRHAVSVPWGDVSTAGRSTGIPNVVVMMAAPGWTTAAMRALQPGARLLGLAPLRRVGQRAVDRWFEGPDEEARRTGRARWWGRATAPDGRRVEGTATTPEGYRFTAVAAVEGACRVAAGPAARRGALSPAQAFGARFLTELPGCDLRMGEVTAAG
ncbi:MAG TPA: saccharopine dehydrogenase NADP-binding domain-containing protein [Gemmatimonadota bacterium]|nr:saccharopine dehydrogenase NADP-binding domain-containing protein [Gemmatimonadota bacterium]